MEHIIQQTAQEFIQRITKKILSEKISNIDSLTVELEEDCKQAAAKILEAAFREMNLAMRRDKMTRKERGLTLKEKERPRSLYTKIGQLNLPRDYYYDKEAEGYTYPLDQMTGLQKRVRIGEAISAELVNYAAEMSYAKSAEVVSKGEISRQSVRNHILKVNLPEDEIPERKRQIQELHVFADEDHVSMQKRSKACGSRNQMVPLITTAEGIRKVGERRNETIRPRRFVEESLSGKELWKTVEGYIGANYDENVLETIYVHGDGGNWIKNGLENYPQVIHVMDGYHFEKRLKSLSLIFPQRNVRVSLRNAIKDNDRRRADRFLQSLMDEADDKQREKVKEFGKYLMGNWETIYRRLTLDIPGSCTEGQVSHVLSERFSRNPMGWSKEALGKLSCIRVSGINGRKIEAKDFREKGRRNRYAEYGEKLIRHSLEGAVDWSIFDGEPMSFDPNSGTQILVHTYGLNHGVLLS